MASYRDTRPATMNSSDDSSSDSNSDEDQPWKRRKTTSQSQAIRREILQPVASVKKKHGILSAKQHAAGPSVAPCDISHGVKRPRRNNVWGQVVMEQNEALVTREMDEFDMELSRSRDVESYNYKLGRDDSTSRVYLGAPSTSTLKPDQERNLKRGFGETEDDDWLVHQETNNDGDDNDCTRKPVHQRLGERDLSHRKIAKARLGSRSESELPDLSPMKFISIEPSLSLKEIAGKLAYSLQEPKGELIVRVMDILGVEKSLELWSLTADIEKDGGMMILNGSRRRSPGGVFLQLMKTDPQITKQQVNKIFTEEKKKENEQKHKREKRRRKKTVQFKDVGEEDVAGKVEEVTEITRDGDKEGCQKMTVEHRQCINVKRVEEVAKGGISEIAEEKGDRNSDMEEGEIDDDDEEDDKIRFKEEKMD